MTGSFSGTLAAKKRFNHFPIVRSNRSVSGLRTQTQWCEKSLMQFVFKTNSLHENFSS